MDERRIEDGFHRILEVWSRRKWLAMLAFAVPFTGTVSLATFLPDVYEATATVLVGRQQVSQTFVKSAVTGELETRLHTISQEILSRSRLQELIDRFGLYQDMRKRGNDPEDILDRMRKDIEIEELKQLQPIGGQTTIAFTLTYRGKNPRLVPLVTNALATLYVEENLKMRQRQATGTAEFLRVQLEEMKKKLEEEERRVGQFKERHVGELPEQQEANLSILQRLNIELRMNTENQMRVMERLEREELTRQLVGADSPTRGGDPLGPEGIVARIGRLKHELTELRTRFNDKYPDVMRVKSEIAALERRLADSKPEGSPAAEPAPSTKPPLPHSKKPRSEIEMELNVLKEQEQSLRETIATYQRRMESAPHREQEFQELSRDYKTTKEIYNTLLQKYEEAKVAASMELGEKDEFRVLDPAIVPENPANESPDGPDRRKLVFIGLILSLALAGVAVVLTEQLDPSFHSVEALRAFTKVPVLASIPQIVTQVDIRRRRWRFGLGSVGAMLGMVFAIRVSYYVAHAYEQLFLKLLRVHS